jgi:C4-dicarboxylate transporter DctM subunit
MILTALFGSFFLLMAIGMPIAFAMAGASVVGLLLEGVPISVVITRIFAGADSFSLLAIPLFLFAGDLMSQGFLTQQLVRFTSKLFGWCPAGTGTVDVVTSMLFAGVSGSGAADTAAVGSVMIPRMIQRGYPRGVAAGLEACAGAIGPIIPPSLFMIIYAGIAEVSVARMFMGGFIPGILIGLGLILILQLWNLRARWEPATGEFPSLREMLVAVREGFAALVAPVIIMGGIVTGVFTATESGAAAAAYALLVSVAKREMGLREIRKALMSSMTLTAACMLPVAAATLFGWILAREQFGVLALGWMTSLSQGSSILAALIIVGFILLIGMPVEPLTIMIVFVPILAPLGPAMGFDPIHWGVVMVMAINLAGITPPVGGLIFLAAAIAKADVQETSRFIVPFVLVEALVVLICLLIPQSVLLIPNLVMGIP